MCTCWLIVKSFFKSKNTITNHMDFEKLLDVEYFRDKIKNSSVINKILFHFIMALQNIYICRLNCDKKSI